MVHNIPEIDKPRLVILGAGFAGLSLALKLRNSQYQTVLIDRNNYHQFQPLFYQVAMAGLEPSSISFPLRKAFQKSKDFYIRVAEVKEIRPDKKCLETNLGVLNYDILVIAMGAKTNFFGNKNLRDKTYTLKSVSGALSLRNAILTDYEEALSTRDYDKRQGLIDTVIVGGGPTGVELAGALAEMKSYILPKDYSELNNKEVDIYLIQSGDRLLKGMSKKAGDRSRKYLEDMGVHVMTGTRVIDYDGEFVYTGDQQKIRAEKVIWAAGIRGVDIKGLEKAEMGSGNRIIVDRYHRVEGYRDIYALGDIAYMSESEYPDGHPQVAQAALQQAKNLAHNLRKNVDRKFAYKDKGSMATIGRNKAVVDLPGVFFTGFPAWMVWLFVHLFAIIGVKNKLFVFINWVWNYLTYDQSLRLIIRSGDDRDEESIG